MNPRWWERFGNLPLMPGLRKGPLGNGDAAPWEHPKFGPMIQLGPGGTSPNVSWEAYPLPINQPGQATFLEIEYPSDVPQSMGISLVEPNAAGAVMPIGLDSGVYVSDEDAENPPQLAHHRVVFWPRTKTPLLLVTNRRQGSRAVYGKITVLGAAHSQFPVLSSLGRAEGGSVLPPAFAEHRQPERFWAGYLDRPLFVENFSAPEALDASSHRSLDDWNTFYQGGIRLVKYLKHVGYGGLMMSAFADGSTIYPSQVVEPTPRYDTGVFFATGQDPRRKDVLELLFRLFDREGLTLIPAVQFASPLAELEALKRDGGPQAAGIEWIGPDGNPWLASNTPRQGLAPYYNLLNPRVQEAMLAVAREVGTRYATHPSFGGLALQLSADGYAQLPGDDWGYDDQTIARFEARHENARAWRRRAAFRGAGQVSGRPRPPGVARVARRSRGRFPSSLARRNRRPAPGAKLYLAGATMLENRQTQYRLRPTLPRRVKLDDAMLELGIRAQSYHEDPGHRAAAAAASQAAGRRSGGARRRLGNQSRAGEMDRVFSAAAQSGSLFYHEPQKARLASFDAKSPFGTANTYTWLVSEMSPSGDRNRRRFVHSLATLDSQEMFDGGWLLPLGQEDSLRDILSVYRSLAPRAFRNGCRRVSAGHDSHAGARRSNVRLSGQRFTVGGRRFAPGRRAAGLQAGKTWREPRRGAAGPLRRKCAMESHAPAVRSGGREILRPADSSARYARDRPRAGSSGLASKDSRLGGAGRGTGKSSAHRHADKFPLRTPARRRRNPRLDCRREHGWQRRARLHATAQWRAIAQTLQRGPGGRGPKCARSIRPRPGRLAVEVWLRAADPMRSRRCAFRCTESLATENSIPTASFPPRAAAPQRPAIGSATAFRSIICPAKDSASCASGSS